jgi:molecular chaperone DnaK (HSP70)
LSHFERIYSPVPLSENSERSSLLINVKENHLELEEVTAMMLEHVREMSEKFGETSVKDCAITVPNFWNRDTRIRMLNSATAAGLNVLTLVNENTAAAFYYGLDRLDVEKDVFVIFYNLGASYLQTTLVRYSTVNTTSLNSSKTIEFVEILAQTFDEHLGGSTFDALLAEYLADKFEASHKVSVKDNKKVMTRLVVQANIAKKVLSASRVSLVIVNNIYKGIDFSYNLKREELESLINSYSERLVKPIKDALEIAGVSKEQVLFLEILGGVSRIPRVQDIIKESTGFDCSTHLNGDESMAHGSALLAANFSSIVQVKPLWLKDVSQKKITAKFLDLEKNVLEELVVFERYSQAGILYYHSTNYTQNVFVELFEGDEQRPLGYYEVTGFENITVTEFKTVFTFAIDYSSLAFLYKVDAVFVETIEKNLSFFEENLTNDQPDLKTEKKLKTKAVPSNETRLIPLKHQFFHTGIPRLLNNTELKRIKTSLQEFKDAEIAARELSEAKNDIESYIYSLSDKLDESLFETVTTSEERDELRNKVQEVKDWMESEEFISASLQNVTDKKKELVSSFKEAVEREKEFSLRDPAVDKARKELKKFEDDLILANKTKPWLPAEEVNLTWKTLNETLEWIENKVIEQKIMQPWQPLAFTSKQVEKKVKTVEGLVEKLKRMAKPKEKKPYFPEFMKFDENFDWEKFKEKYAKEQAEKEKKDDTDDQPAESEEKHNQEEKKNDSEEPKTDDL